MKGQSNNTAYRIVWEIHWNRSSQRFHLLDLHVTPIKFDLHAP